MAFLEIGCKLVGAGYDHQNDTLVIKVNNKVEDLLDFSVEQATKIFPKCVLQEWCQVNFNVQSLDELGRKLKNTQHTMMYLYGQLIACRPWRSVQALFQRYEYSDYVDAIHLDVELEKTLQGEDYKGKWKNEHFVGLFDAVTSVPDSTKKFAEGLTFDEFDYVCCHFEELQVDYHALSARIILNKVIPVMSKYITSDESITQLLQNCRSEMAKLALQKHFEWRQTEFTETVSNLHENFGQHNGRMKTSVEEYKAIIDMHLKISCTFGLELFAYDESMAALDQIIEVLDKPLLIYFVNTLCKQITSKLRTDQKLLWRRGLLGELSEVVSRLFFFHGQAIRSMNADGTFTGYSHILCFADLAAHIHLADDPHEDVNEDANEDPNEDVDIKVNDRDMKVNGPDREELDAALNHVKTVCTQDGFTEEGLIIVIEYAITKISDMLIHDDVLIDFVIYLIENKSAITLLNADFVYFWLQWFFEIFDDDKVGDQWYMLTLELNLLQKFEHAIILGKFMANSKIKNMPKKFLEWFNKEMGYTVANDQWKVI